MQHQDACGAAIHGYELMSELMTDLTPLTGKLYLEGLYYTRLAREAYVLIGGKYPHPQTVVPGGVSTTIDASDLNEICCASSSTSTTAARPPRSGTTSPSSSTRSTRSTATSARARRT